MSGKLVKLFMFMDILQLLREMTVETIGSRSSSVRILFFLNSATLVYGVRFSSEQEAMRSYLVTCFESVAVEQEFASAWVAWPR